MTKDEFKNLQIGDIVQNVGSGNVYVIIDIHRTDNGFYYQAIRPVSVSQPGEWELIKDSNPPSS